MQNHYRRLPSPFWLLLLAVPLALLPFRIALGASLGMVLLILTLIDPIWALYAAILSVPVQELIQLPGGLSITQATLLLMLGSLGLHTLAAPERPLRFGRLFGPLALFLLALLSALIFTPFSRTEATRELLRWATVPLVYLLTLRALDGRAGQSNWRVYGLLACLLLAPASNAALGLVQFWFGIGPESFGAGGGRMRAYGTIGQPNSFAGYMNQAWPLALSLTGGVGVRIIQGVVGAHATRAHQQHRTQFLLLALLGGTTGLLLAGLLTSFSRGGWVGALGGMVVLSLATLIALPAPLRRWAQRGMLGIAGGMLLLILLGGGGLLPSSLAGRLGSITSSLRLFDVRGAVVTPENFAVVERMAHIQAAWNMYQRYPITGVGPGNYSLAFESLPDPGMTPISTRPWYTSRGHAHNYYLHIAAEAGSLGLAAYLFLLAGIAYQAVRAIRSAPNLLWLSIALGATGISATVAVHNLFENLHVLNMGLQLGTIWALLVLAEGHHKEQKI
ncbi:O-antigen polymerase [Oscillochloris trichoides DG-6]|uniref:O-antigen polymerase n=1 Tax=Oscillochloris trichoides DG-6 TaxID=765420 RepID=E1IAX5_9CHLR|nr:O-antigen ligase family protein [Oscillochloris trichoides]EFO81621.1 O-antigen polymerase [Oscillochloris trichoides DG-6]